MYGRGVTGAHSAALPGSPTDTAYTEAGGSDAAIEVRLTLAATPRVLPVSETLTTNGETKTVTFSRWGMPFTVVAPAPVILYSQVTS